MGGKGGRSGMPVATEGKMEKGLSLKGGGVGVVRLAEGEGK